MEIFFGLLAVAAAAGKNNVELLVFADCGHSECNFNELFWPRVNDLLDRAFA